MEDEPEEEDDEVDSDLVQLFDEINIGISAECNEKLLKEERDALDEDR